ncbi:carbohydrate binding domain-containing protein [Mesobacillus subterraneus]|uniref:carbohydrate binding domain-containing protein n=1 Tax=Mesobacillus subterraneus TaxID=285983 RepID=UPI0020414FFA|nr:carbohydrate binding domain-containing protein [Mesobacillus subterraneus]MCM3665171.1 carbohydrate binding domain-containing protein [Mesobacillus subterraneus]MCM3684184.1 carbohydrate binding domain-containing protein [Mesobacillus subterraneus]
MKKTLAVLLSAMMILPGISSAAPNGNDGKKLDGKQNKSEWSLVWNDEFNGKEIDRSKWTFDIGNWIVDENGNGITSGWGNNEKEYYTDSNENAFIDDGKLVIKAKEEKVTDQFGTYDYTSAKLKTKGLFSKKYGRYEIKAKLPVGKGLWPAIWMLPEEDKYGTWAASGEIDIMEAWGSRPNTVSGTIHYGEGWPNNKYTGKEFELPENRGIDKWHTYALEWEPGELRWYVDGQLYQTQNKWYSKGKDNAANFSYPAPFDQEFYLVMNLAVGGWFDGDPDETTKFPSQMEVDYVRVYDLKKRVYREPVEPVSGPVVLPENAKHPVDGNLIYDQNYEEPITVVDEPSETLNSKYWNFVKLPEFGGAGTLEVEEIDGKNYARTDISYPGSQLYSLQMIQNISLGNGGKYKVNFDAKSTSPRNIMVKAGAGPSRGWVKYSNEESFKLTSDVQRYEFTFDMLNETDIESRLEFNLGGNGTNPVWIGNVKVEDITGAPVDEDGPKQPLPGGNHIYNGTFDQGGMDRLMFWNFSVGDAAAAASVSEDARELHVSIEDEGSHPEAIKLDQQGVNLVKGNDYKLSFKARADEPRTIQAVLLNKAGTSDYSGINTIELTSNMEEKIVEFTMPEDVSDPEAQLVFSFGDEAGDVYMDDVVLLKTSNIPDYGNIDLYPLKNGDFSDGLSSWGSYVHFDANAQIAPESGEAKVAIGSEGNETWSVLLEQGNLSLAKGVVYELSFAARSTKERKAEVTVENAAYTRFLSESITLSDQMQQYTYEFEMPIDDITAFKMLLGKTALSPIGEHDVFIDNVVLKVKDAPSEPEPEPVSTPGIDNGTFSDGTNGWTAWWGDQWSGYGAGTMTAENGELKVAISQVGGQSYAPQVFQKGLLFDNGASYTVTFEARADVPRKMNVNIGKELSFDPWFIYYMPTKIVDLTSEMQTYSYTFVMNEATYADGKIVFELGNILDGNAATNVYLDNVSITKN